MSNRGVVTISSKLLTDLLGIEVEIMDARVDHFQGGEIQLAISHPSLRDVPEGGFPYPVDLETLRKWKDENDNQENPDR